MKTEDRRSRLLALVEHMQGADDDITGRLNAHEERIDDLCRQLRETMRQPVAPPIDVDTLRAICAWIGHVKHEGTMVAESWDRWTLTGENGRWFRVTAESSGVVLSDGDGRDVTLTLAEAHDGQWAADCRKWLNGGDRQPEPQAVKPVEAAALEFVQELQKLAAPVDVVSNPCMWTLTRQGRTVHVVVDEHPDAFYVDPADSVLGYYVQTESTGTIFSSLRRLSTYLRGA